MDTSSLGFVTLLWAVCFVVAILSKSLIAYLILIFASVMGFMVARTLEGPPLEGGPQWAIASVYVVVCAFAVFQLLTKAERI